jgi:hypothetical protein
VPGFPRLLPYDPSDAPMVVRPDPMNMVLLQVPPGLARFTKLSRGVLLRACGGLLSTESCGWMGLGLGDQ